MINTILKKLGFGKKQLKKNNDKYPYTKQINALETTFDFWIADDTGAQWYDHNFWEGAIELSLIKAMIKPDDSVLEIGVHHGFTAAFISKNLNESGQFSGIELSPKSAMIAQAQLKLNRLGNNFSITNAAASDKEGFINFYNSEDGNASINANETTFTIKAITGDGLLPSLGKVDLLKIDVEGFEIQVLKGCTEILKTIPKIAIEIHLDLLAKYGFTAEEIFKIIPIEKYYGKYFWNPGSQYIRPDAHLVKEFENGKLPETGIVNLFLFPK